MHLTQNLNAAYELIEVRTGKGMRPIYRIGKSPTGTLEAVQEEARHILDKAWGEDGKIKRENMKKLQEKVMYAWDADGPAEKEMERFVATVCA